MAAVRHYHHHYHFSYTTSLKRHFLSVLVVLFVLFLLLFFAFRFITPTKPLINLDQISALDLLEATFVTFYRLTWAYILALVTSIPLALLITSKPKVEKVLLPFFDILQSIPALAFFPIIVLVFIKANFFDGAAVFIIFLSMLWNLVFSMIGGLKTIPQDIESAAFVFKATGWKKLFNITLPAIFPYIITGSLLAWAQGWNVIIVAEVLHNYIPGGTSFYDLFGLGSLLVQASYQGKNSIFLASILVMVILITLLNFFIWQKLLHFVERYKFD
ncbi:MAG: ABC transporter permease subunit [Patescibacteria group bacterium]|nr:ABC transporter permease subunit [Patescibacteria group bacterium]